MAHIVIVAAAILVGLVVWAGFTFTRFARSTWWMATVPPLASIIGSGFLVCGPLLAREFGMLAAPAMAVLLVFAYAVGAVIRFNIAHAEPLLERVDQKHPVQWAAWLSQGVLAIAYAISVAYYLKLLAVFVLKPLDIDSNLVANLVVTALLVILAVIAFTGGLRRVSHVAEASVAAKLGLIAGMLAALAIAWILVGGDGAPAPTPRIGLNSLFLLLGLLITVQGFETSRYMGETYERQMRIRTMRAAQGIAAVIYIAFLALLTPHMGQAAATQGVAGVLDVMESVAPALGALVLAAAAASQLSAAVADSIGSAGIAIELSRQRLTVATGFVAAAALSVLVTWLTDALQVIAVASRAFAIYYALQCGVAMAVVRAEGGKRYALQAGLFAIGLLCLVAAIAGAPAEG